MPESLGLHQKQCIERQTCVGVNWNPQLCKVVKKREISGAQIKTPVSENGKSFVFTFLSTAIHSSWIIHHVRSTSVALPMWSSGWWYFSCIPDGISLPLILYFLAQETLLALTARPLCPSLCQCQASEKRNSGRTSAPMVISRHCAPPRRSLSPPSPSILANQWK